MDTKENIESIINKLYTPEQQQEIKDAGYRAHAAGKDMTRGNEYPSTDPRHWLWRRGYLEAFKDANGL